MGPEHAGGGLRCRLPEPAAWSPQTPPPGNWLPALCREPGRRAGRHFRSPPSHSVNGSSPKRKLAQVPWIDSTRKLSLTVTVCPPTVVPPSGVTAPSAPGEGSVTGCSPAGASPAGASPAGASPTASGATTNGRNGSRPEKKVNRGGL